MSADTGRRDSDPRALRAIAEWSGWRVRTHCQAQDLQWSAFVLKGAVLLPRGIWAARSHVVPPQLDIVTTALSVMLSISDEHVPGHIEGPKGVGTELCTSGVRGVEWIQISIAVHVCQYHCIRVCRTACV